jgi:hypothetical protein
MSRRTVPSTSDRIQNPDFFPSSVDLHSEEAPALYGSVPFVARTFSYVVLLTRLSPDDATRTHLSAEKRKGDA